ncbi:MAG TPA: beta-ketoacyl synthase N-terminal-like domain-containing protein [Polyangia bacterium]|nr:beta-ketoacyl synthase N-terminal-like domain-containing protein [Polyangia bacterium]
MTAASALVTGLGAHSAFGRGVDALWQGALSGQTAIRAGRYGWAASVAGGVDVLSAAREAIEDAQLQAADVRAAALVCGTTTGGMARWLAGETGPELAYHGPAAALARALGLGGPLLVPSVACASGTAAVGMALDLVRSERAQVVLCGGTDVLTEFVAHGFAALQALDPNGPARPFDRSRAGLSLGEGAAFLVLEGAAHAARRRPRARLVGAGLAGDAVHMTAPDREGRGAARAIRAALADAGLPPSAVDFVSAHGTGTSFNDAMEARALQAAGVAHAPVHGLKGALGHTLGAAGAFEALLCVRVLETGLIPPTAGLSELDPSIALDVVARAPRCAAVRVALSTSSGFGGMNAAVVLSH